MELRNHDTVLTIPLPHAVNGFYRGQRFAWGGMVTQWRWRNHTLFTQLKRPQDPLSPDGAAGACEEFGMDTALGYEDAAAGARFAKIGVGALIRTSADPYQFNVRYAIAEAGAWVVTSTASEALFRQAYHLNALWAWRYEVRIVAESDGFRIERRLENLGTRAIDTDHYCHNMFAVDDGPIDGSWEMHFAGSLVPSHPTGQFTVADGTVTLTGPVKGALWSAFSWDDKRPSDKILLEHWASRTRISMTLSGPPSKMALYAEATAICPEAFTALHIVPGQSMAWSTKYAVAEDAPP